jgi:hypothetical protein
MGQRENFDSLISSIPSSKKKSGKQNFLLCGDACVLRVPGLIAQQDPTMGGLVLTRFNSNASDSIDSQKSFQELSKSLKSVWFIANGFR